MAGLRKFEPWMFEGACVDHSRPDIFFPARETDRKGRPARKVLEAKAVCATCPVTAQCLEFALASGSLGIWGGLTESERGELRRRD